MDIDVPKLLRESADLYQEAATTPEEQADVTDWWRQLGITGPGHARRYAAQIEEARAGRF